MERQRVANRHGRRTRRRPWRSALVSLVALRGLRPPEEPGAEPFSERVRQLCQSPPAGTCSMHPRRGHDPKLEERFPATTCVVCMRCMHSVFSTHAWQAAHPVLEQPRIEGACRGHGRRWNSGARFMLPFRGHSPGPSGLGGVYFSNLLRANIFRSTAGQGSVRCIAESSWRGARRGVVDTVLGCSRTGFCTSRSEAFESLKGVREQWCRKAQSARDVHRRRARGVGG